MIEDALKPPSGWKLVPAYPDELSIQAGCLSQSDGACASYMEWVDTHSSGIIERIRHCVINDYMSMLSAAPKYEGKS